MLSAIDTNIISSLWSQEKASQGMAAILFKCKQEGGLIIAAPVYAELLAYPKATKPFLDNFLHKTGIQVQFELNKDIWLKAGEAYAEYATRRRKTKDGQPKRLLIDFLIGAHALIDTDRLLTLDKNRYLTSYPKLELI